MNRFVLIIFRVFVCLMYLDLHVYFLKSVSWKKKKKKRQKWKQTIHWNNCFSPLFLKYVNYDITGSCFYFSLIKSCKLNYSADVYSFIHSRIFQKVFVVICSALFYRKTMIISSPVLVIKYFNKSDHVFFLSSVLKTTDVNLRNLWLSSWTLFKSFCLFIAISLNIDFHK